MRSPIGALAVAAMLAASQGAAAQDPAAGARRNHDPGHLHSASVDQPDRDGRFAYAQSPAGWSYPAPGGYYTPFVDLALEGGWGRPTHPSDCGHWEEGLEAGRYVWIQTACTAPQTGWSLH